MPRAKKRQNKTTEYNTLRKSKIEEIEADPFKIQKNSNVAYQKYRMSNRIPPHPPTKKTFKKNVVYCQFIFSSIFKKNRENGWSFDHPLVTVWLSWGVWGELENDAFTFDHPL